MSAKYNGSFYTNNGSTISSGWEFTNKRTAIKTMREICRGNTFLGQEGRVCICDANGNNIYSGTVR